MSEVWHDEAYRYYYRQTRQLQICPATNMDAAMNLCLSSMLLWLYLQANMWAPVDATQRMSYLNILRQNTYVTLVAALQTSIWNLVETLALCQVSAVKMEQLIADMELAVLKMMVTLTWIANFCNCFVTTQAPPTTVSALERNQVTLIYR